MRADIVEKVSMDLLSIPPLVFRAVRNRITKTILSDPDLDITPHQFEILGLLAEEGTMHSSEIGERLQIGKAQMTQLINRLVVLKVVERTMNESDRRTYNIHITADAARLLEEHKRKVVMAVKGIMSSLSDQELENLSVSLRSLRDTLLRSTTDISR
jgi:DNA-binding MarR family transcriptional regulator